RPQTLAGVASNPCCGFSLYLSNTTAPTEIYTLSLHDALPILAPVVSASGGSISGSVINQATGLGIPGVPIQLFTALGGPAVAARSEEHTSELQSREKLVCRLLLEKRIRSDLVRVSLATLPVSV